MFWIKKSVTCESIHVILKRDKSDKIKGNFASTFLEGDLFSMLEGTNTKYDSFHTNNGEYVKIIEKGNDTIPDHVLKYSNIKTPLDILDYPEVYPLINDSDIEYYKDNITYDLVKKYPILLTFNDIREKYEILKEKIHPDIVEKYM